MIDVVQSIPDSLDRKSYMYSMNIGAGDRLGLVNTQGFREAAIYFEKHGRYDDGVEGTPYYDKWWKEQKRRCLEGYTSGGVYISGYYYHYLNFCRIELVKETYGEVHKNKAKTARKTGVRVEDFPAFWDVDYMYFTALDIAANGITDEDYNNLPIEMNIRPEFRDGGRHLVWLKPRGVGASWKAGSMPVRNYALVEKSKSYMLANEKEFLTKDGLFTKFLSIRDWQFVNVAGLARSSEFKKDRNGMHFKSSVDLGGGVEGGYQAEVIGVSLQNNWQKARGKRGMLILWEELGKFPNADLAWEVARPSIEEGNVVYGTMIGFGTGGTKDANFESLKKMFYNPLDYNILPFDNIYDVAFAGNLCGMFTPAYKNIAFKDKDGNSDEVSGKQFFDKERALAKESSDPTLLPRKKAENPYTPQEAVLETGDNIFISDALVAHKNYVEVKGLHKVMATQGMFERPDGGLKFKVIDTLTPIHIFPHKGRYSDYTGAVLIFEAPFRKNGKVPKNLYTANIDTYRHDATTGDSVGAVYILENSNNLTRTKGDKIVACYVGRPEKQEKFNEIAYDLAEYYNALIGFENDEPGDLVGYGKRHKKLHLLSEEFELAYDETLKGSSSTKRGFGMHMGTGKENLRKKQGDIYIKDWLYTVRYIDEDGKKFCNFHFIYDLGLLEELVSYKSGGNFDRISALRVGMFHQRELMYKEIEAELEEDIDEDDFFRRDLFSVNDN